MIQEANDMGSGSTGVMVGAEAAGAGGTTGPSPIRTVGSGVVPVGLVALSLTHVQHQHGDKIGKALAYVTLAPLVLLVAYPTLILARWAEPVWRIMLVGQLANEALNVVLKNYIQEHRPEPHTGKGYGMPSSHAQFMAYFTLFSWFLLRSHFVRVPAFFRIVVGAGIGVFSALVCYSRVYLAYHSPLQVLAGGVCGAVFASLWIGFLKTMGWDLSRLRAKRKSD